MALPLARVQLRWRNLRHRLHHTSSHIRILSHGRRNRARTQDRKVVRQCVRRPLQEVQVDGHGHSIDPVAHRPVLLRHRRMGHQMVRRVRHRSARRTHGDRILVGLHHRCRGRHRRPDHLVPRVRSNGDGLRHHRSQQGNREAQQDPAPGSPRHDGRHHHLRPGSS